MKIWYIKYYNSYMLAKWCCLCWIHEKPIKGVDYTLSQFQVDIMWLLKRYRAHDMLTQQYDVQEASPQYWGWCWCWSITSIWMLDVNTFNMMPNTKHVCWAILMPLGCHNKQPKSMLDFHIARCHEHWLTSRGHYSVRNWQRINYHWGSKPPRC